MADIYNADQFMAGRWKWTAGGYDAQLPGRCAFGDVDAITERNGQVLIIESKYWNGVGDAPPFTLPVGQRILYETLTTSNQTFVLLLGEAGDENNPWAAESWHRMPSGQIKRKPRDWRTLDIEGRRNALKALIRGWAQHATRAKRRAA